MIQTRRDCKLAGPDRLRISRDLPEVKQRVEQITALLKELSEK